jgi:hypothetical protein
VENTQWDDLDRQLAHALAVAPRAPFKQIADVLGVSDQTIARRFRKLTATASLGVRGTSSPGSRGDTRHLYEYMTTRLPGVPGIRSVETALVIGTAKRTSPGGVSGGRGPWLRSG